MTKKMNKSNTDKKQAIATKGLPKFMPEPSFDDDGMRPIHWFKLNTGQERFIHPQTITVGTAGDISKTLNVAVPDRLEDETVIIHIVPHETIQIGGYDVDEMLILQGGLVNQILTDIYGRAYEADTDGISVCAVLNQDEAETMDCYTVEIPLRYEISKVKLGGARTRYVLNAEVNHTL